MDDNRGEWVECMGVVRRRWVWLVGEGGIYGCGCKEVYRFPHTTYPYSSVSVLFCSSIPTFCSYLKTFFVLVSTWFEVSLVSADHLSVLTGPLRVCNSTPHSRQVDFNSTFPWVGPSNQTYLFRVILTLCKELQSFYIIYIYIY